MNGNLNVLNKFTEMLRNMTLKEANDANEITGFMDPISFGESIKHLSNREIGEVIIDVYLWYSTKTTNDYYRDSNNGMLHTVKSGGHYGKH